MVALVIVGCGSGSPGGPTPAGITQSAAEVHAPTGTDPTSGGLTTLSCRAAGNCLAIGFFREPGSPTSATYLLHRPGAAWTKGGPWLHHAGGGIGCPSVDLCWRRTGKQLSFWGRVGQSWHETVLRLPGVTARAQSLSSFSCPSAGNCVAVDAVQQTHGTRSLLLAESEGAWHSTAPHGGSVALVSCPSVGSCTAVGSYRRKDAKGGGYGSYPWVLDEKGGTWGRGHGAKLPPDAATTRDFRGASPFMGFSGLSCPTAGNCTAVGGYVDRHGDYQGLILAERDGRWLPGIRAPLPANAVSNNDPNELQNPLVAVSCAAPDDCGAVGWFVTDQSGIRHGLLLSERHGRWQASEIALSKGASGGVGLSSIVCPSPGNCVATGYGASDEQTPSGNATYGVIVAERGGSWGRGFTAATPQDAAGGKNSRVFLGPLSCPSARTCTVLGSYLARADQSSSDPPSKGMLLDLGFR